jgi:spore germination cell wall hydrolase CwlJ-like protein
MTKVQTKYISWGLVSGAFICAATAFPTISGSAEAQLKAAVWADRAEAIESVDVAAVQDSVVISRLANLQTNQDLSPLMRDASVTGSLLSYTRDELNAAISGTEELHCLSEAVYYEARSETRSGQKAVAEVVLNRVASKHFPDSVCGVVYEGSERRTGCQFSFTCDGSMDIAPTGKSWERSQDVAALVLSGGVKPFTNKSTHYHTTAVDPVWSGSLRMTKHVGSHVFYRFAPRNYEVSTPALTVAPPS